MASYNGYHWSEGTHKTIAISMAVAFIAFLVTISIWIAVCTQHSKEVTTIRARACMKAPSAQVATCLKLNG